MAAEVAFVFKPAVGAFYFHSLPLFPNASAQCKSSLTSLQGERADILRYIGNRNQKKVLFGWLQFPL
jgi:hypothetical protein